MHTNLFAVQAGIELRDVVEAAVDKTQSLQIFRCDSKPLGWVAALYKRFIKSWMNSKWKTSPKRD